MHSYAQAPFTYFGGKSTIAATIWERLGDVAHYVEPFAGSLAVLLHRPRPHGLETVNDKDAYLANVWRAIQADPSGVLAWCLRQPNEADLHAVHSWLVQHREDFTARIMGDPDYYDVRIAGRWLYGVNLVIGGGWCSGEGPWTSQDGRLVNTGDRPGISKQLIRLNGAGVGIYRKRLQLGHRGNKIHAMATGHEVWFNALRDRLQQVRVACGDWRRILTPAVLQSVPGPVGIVLDPPYALEENREMGIYAMEDGAVAHTVREWCLAHGHMPQLRIILCGYGTTHNALLDAGWSTHQWKANGGMGNQAHGRGRANAQRECLWISPHCMRPQQISLF